MLARSKISPRPPTRCLTGSTRTEVRVAGTASAPMREARPARAVLKYSDPQLVGIVTRFYYDDYVTFQIPLPSFARRTLDQLAARRDPFAMPTEQLNVLAAIRGPGIGRFP